MILDCLNRIEVTFYQRQKTFARKSRPKSTAFDNALFYWIKRLCNNYIVIAKLSEYALSFIPVGLDDEISHRTRRKGLWLAFIKLSLVIFLPTDMLESIFYVIVRITKLIHVVHFFDKGWFFRFEIVDSCRVLNRDLKVIFQFLYRVCVYSRWWKAACLNKWNQIARI